MDLASILSVGAGLYGGYKGHQARAAIRDAIEEQTGVLREQFALARDDSGPRTHAGDGRGRYVDVSV
ncbi:hypothetical protein [Halorhodospira abdelmalekii]|uniref:hypothetical protein n=1 Tax=Halorhodospira abdelmalekii TaxID=421629 RepID=UPI00190675CD|nr:hypothetical protein [Halorhodospira abdelmalekii]